MILRSTLSTVILCVRSVFHHHRQKTMMKTGISGRKPVHSRINIDDQKRKMWNMLFQEVFGVEVIKLEYNICCYNNVTTRQYNDKFENYSIL